MTGLDNAEATTRREIMSAPSVTLRHSAMDAIKRLFLMWYL